MSLIPKKLDLLFKRKAALEEKARTGCRDFANKRIEEVASCMVEIMEKNPEVFCEDFIEIKLDGVINYEEELIMLEEFIKRKKQGVEIEHNLSEKENVSDYAISLKKVKKILEKK